MFYFRIVPFCLLFVNVLGYIPKYYDLENAEQHFADFIEKYEKKYESAEEYSRRFEIFKANLKKINKWNYYNEQGNKGGYEVTRFSDQDGYQSCVDASKLLNRTHAVPVKREFIENAPDHLDYRERNLVTEIKNQGECGDCYVFAAIGNIEGMHAVATGNLVSLSEQQGLDCVSSGCQGGLEIEVINALASQGGSMSEQGYPYVGVKGTCHTDQSQIQAKVLSGNVMPTPDVETLKGALYQNGAPIAIHLYASSLVEQAVGAQILNPSDCQDNQPNHAVLLVGYSTDAASGRPYWIIKNSWGTDHGDNGYFYFDMECRCSIGVDGATTSQVQ